MTDAETVTRSRLAVIPNLLTLSRLLLAPIVWELIAYEQSLGAIIVFAVAAITDGFDGFLARRWNATSTLGRQLDPLVDKVIVAGCYLYLLSFPVERTGIRPWMVAVIVSRELIIQAIRSLIEGHGEPFGAKMAGKLKTTFQFLSILAATWWLSHPLDGDWWIARDALTWTAVVLTIYSGLGYVRLAWPKLKPDLGP